MENKIIATNGKINFWYIEGEVYRSSSNAVMDINGFPQDRRWECSYKHYLAYKNTVFNWVVDIDDYVSTETVYLSRPKQDFSNWLP